VGQFVTDGNLPSYLPWDRIANAGTTASTGITDRAACQAACAANAKCQYFEFYNYTVSGDQCFLRLAAADIAKPAGMVAGANADPYVLFEVKTGLYATYAAADFAEGGSIGTTIGSGLTFAAAKDACDKDPACIGFANTAATDTWRTFAGEKWEDVTGKVRVVGEAINAWIAEPAA
jgi:hypothetical protein